MTENRIVSLCRMITWIEFLRMFWNFISSLPVKRGGSLSFLVRAISNVLVMEIGWTDVGSRGYILVSCAHSNTSFYSLGLYCWWWNYNKIKIACCITEWREAWSINCLSENNTHLLYMVWYKIWRYIVCLIIHTGKSLVLLN